MSWSRLPEHAPRAPTPSPTPSPTTQQAPTAVQQQVPRRPSGLLRPTPRAPSPHVTRHPRFTAAREAAGGARARRRQEGGRGGGTVDRVGRHPIAWGPRCAARQVPAAATARAAPQEQGGGEAAAPVAAEVRAARDGPRGGRVAGRGAAAAARPLAPRARDAAARPVGPDYRGPCMKAQWTRRLYEDAHPMVPLEAASAGSRCRPDSHLSCRGQTSGDGLSALSESSSKFVPSSPRSSSPQSPSPQSSPPDERTAAAPSAPSRVGPPPPPQQSVST